MEQQPKDLIIEAKWVTGQRTPLGDALWHRILADIAPHGRLQPPSDCGQARETDE